MIQEFCALSDKLEESDIHCGDKTLSWDGNIIFYEEGKHKAVGKEHLIPIQIKGKEVRHLSRSEHITYPVSYRDLNNYLNDKGIIFFVVEIEKESHSKKMYTRILLPVDLKKLLRGKRQKTKSIELYWVKNETELEELCNFFVSNWPKQTVVLYRDENQNLIVPNKLTFSGIHIPTQFRDNPIQAIVYAKQGYLYLDQGGVEIPVLAEHLTASTDKKALLSIDGDYTATLEQHIVYSREQADVAFNKIFHLIYYIKDGEWSGKTTFKIECAPERTLAESEPIARMLDGLSNDKNVMLNGFEFTDDIRRKLNEIIGEDSRKFYQIILDTSKLCRKLKISVDALTAKEAIQEMQLLKDLEKCLIGKQKTSLTGAGIAQNGYYYQKIGSKQKLISFEKQEDGEFYLMDPFSEETELEVYYKSDGKSERVSKWFIIDPKRIPTLLIDREQMLNDLKVIEKEAEFSGITQFLLELLNHYDKSKDKTSLHFAEQICELIFSLTPEDTATQINKYQIKFRKCRLDEADKQELAKLKFNNDPTVVACAAVLLDQRVEFEMAFDKLSPVQQGEFKTWPIYRLYLKLKEGTSTSFH